MHGEAHHNNWLGKFRNFDDKSENEAFVIWVNAKVKQCYKSLNCLAFEWNSINSCSCWSRFFLDLVRRFIDLKSFLMSLASAIAIKEDPVPFVSIAAINKSTYLTEKNCTMAATAYPTGLLVSNGNLQNIKISYLSHLKYWWKKYNSLNSSILPHWKWQF